MAAAKRNAPELYVLQPGTTPTALPIWFGQKWMPSGERTTLDLTPAIVGPVHDSKKRHGSVETKD